MEVKKAKANLSFNPTITLELSRNEAAALKALTVFGVDAFLDKFFKELGRADLKPVENDFKDLFKSLEVLGYEINKIDKLKKLITDNAKEIGLT